MNLDRQKILLIFAGAWVSAALLTWLVYAKAVAPHSEKMADAIAVTRDLPAGTRLKKTDLKLIKVTEKDMPRTAVADMNQSQNVCAISLLVKGATVDGKALAAQKGQV